MSTGKDTADEVEKDKDKEEDLDLDDEEYGGVVSAAMAEMESEKPTLPPNIEKIDDDALRGDKCDYHVKTPVLMPDMVDTNDRDNVIEKWHKQPGDVVQRNDVLCDITTPDFTFGMVTEDEFDAVMGEVLVPEGKKVADNEPICYLYHQETPGKTKDKETKVD